MRRQTILATALRRRDVVAALTCGAMVATHASRAQQPGHLRRVGVLMPLQAEDPTAQDFVAAFVQGLRHLGWSEGRNLHVDIRWAGSNPDSTRMDAVELLARAPDVILAMTGIAAAAVQQASAAQPLVFVATIDPVGMGLVDSLARPGGNTTGFVHFEYSLGAKWLELLKQIAPSVTRAAIIRDPTLPGSIGQFSAIQTAAASLGIEISPVDARDAGAIERGVAAFARTPSGGLVVTQNPRARVHRELVIALAARHRLPAIYPVSSFVELGGLMSYSPDAADQFRLAAGYVDRILRGEKPADLPVQAPTRYELVINLRTAKALNLTIPPAVLARADEVIE